MTTNRPLRVFLCHSSNDKPAVRELYQKLRAESWIQPWLDEEELYPGQDWNMEIEKAVEAADAIIVCLSNNSITKEGYVQKEIKTALDFSDYKPEGIVFIIPVRLEDCKPPSRLSKWQHADYFEGQRERALERLIVSLKRRADSLGLEYEIPHLKQKEKKTIVETQKDVRTFRDKVERLTNTLLDIASKPVEPKNKMTLSNGMEFMCVPAGKFLMGSENGYGDEKPQHTVELPDYWIARYPLTNELYNTYAKSKGIKHPVDDWEKKKDHPVVYVKWTEAMEYCQWVNNLLKKELPSGLVLRLPTEAEWEKAARGTDGREYPWGSQFDKNKCNTKEGGKLDTTSVGLYSPQGDSHYGCADMSGNVWEWTHSLKKKYPYNVKDGREDEKVSDIHVLRGGSFGYSYQDARCACRFAYSIFGVYNYLGFRMVVSPVLS